MNDWRMNEWTDVRCPLLYSARQQDSGFHITCVHVQYWTRFGFRTMCDVTDRTLVPSLQINNDNNKKKKKSVQDWSETFTHLSQEKDEESKLAIEKVISSVR